MLGLCLHLLKLFLSTETRNYVSGIEYLGANLEAIYHAEGRCTPNGATAFHYEYTLKDHLGNARVNFRANGTAVTFLEEMHYYPFGMLMEGIGTAAVTVNKYKYNGKELNDDLGLNWYDYGARWYDAALGRWWSVDPTTEFAANWTSYRYGFNSPVVFMDLFGMWEKDANGNWTTNDAKDIARFAAMLEIENSIEGDVSIAQIDQFITEEWSGQGGRMSNGSILLSPVEMAKGKMPDDDKDQIRREVKHYSSFAQNAGNWVNGFSPYPYKYYRERSWSVKDGSFEGVSLPIAGFAADYASHFLHNKYWWFSVKQNKVYSQSFNGNQYTGGKVKDAKSLSTKVGVVGKVVSIYGAVGTAQEWKDKALTNSGGAYLLTSDLVGIFGGIHGSAISLGATMGKAITQSDWYFNEVHANKTW